MRPSLHFLASTKTAWIIAVITLVFCSITDNLSSKPLPHSLSWYNSASINMSTRGVFANTGKDDIQSNYYDRIDTSVMNDYYAIHASAYKYTYDQSNDTAFLHWEEMTGRFQSSDFSFTLDSLNGAIPFFKSRMESRVVGKASEIVVHSIILTNLSAEVYEDSLVVVMKGEELTPHLLDLKYSYEYGDSYGRSHKSILKEYLSSDQANVRIVIYHENDPKSTVNTLSSYKDNLLQLFPNPCSNRLVGLNLTSNENGMVDVKIYNDNGSLMHVSQFYKSNNTETKMLPIAELLQGTYLIVVREEGVGNLPIIQRLVLSK